MFARRIAILGVAAAVVAVYVAALRVGELVTGRVLLRVEGGTH